MGRIYISGSGLFTPSDAISNEELVASFNEYAAKFNAAHAADIEAGQVAEVPASSEAFIVKASGIKSRYVLNKDGVLDPERMRPRLPRRSENEASIQCEMSVLAAREALERAGKQAADIDAVVVACSNLQRGYPAVAVEVQQALGIDGFAFDMNVACSSATFGLQVAADTISRGNARAVLVISPEICSGHLNFCDRDSHFIFGDACTAMVVEQEDTLSTDSAYEILGTRLKTQFSNNIRNDFGFLNRAEEPPRPQKETLFRQQGRKVFKEVVPIVNELILSHLADLGLGADDIRRLWLHQANINMNQLIAKRVLGHAPSDDEAPTILDRYANTSSAGSIIAFHQHHEDLAAGDVGVICSFGAGYSAGSVVVRRWRR
ncbi:beta-ketoacyl-ACP synthase III [Alkalilimnicola ehrlichii]|uniref:Beta-ketoacyl-ACP synthase III n=1 Tax=Alkalilimnicola ehrlichii TaxID=351052 RepID=A0A3E0WTC1_9GAMM|nr:beta-ketoacyl-ACP synthase III [Alkalilimnicola ehrlichii]RFA29175.1 beta-ketoacyl-ACP synthase III [Alkalilimnicola ehrlichii]RFA36088.1 beta-ketoacyl-ACP synthase III [Alkalilimnicola ehrlichii]